MESLSASIRSLLPPRSPREPLLGVATRLPGQVRGGGGAGRLLATPAEAAERTAHRELAEAARGEGLVLYAQPIADAGDGGVVGHELLVRWQHPRRGLLLPEAFIPLAEANGLIVEIDRWVVGRAIDHLRRWRRRGYRGMLAVNVSVRSLEDASFVEELLDRVKTCREVRGHLVLERTETAETLCPTGVRKALARLRSAGVKVALDDFGAGHTSYEQLVGQSFDVLKVDRALLADIHRDRGAQTVVRSLLHMARSLGVTLVAEGVESEGQRAWLAAEGGMLVQGYAFGRPAPLPVAPRQPPGQQRARTRARRRRTDMGERAPFPVGLMATLMVVAQLLVGQAASPPSTASASAGAAQALTEVMVTDAGGQRLVGYGTVSGGKLTLRLSASGSRVVLALVAPDGTVQTVQAVRGGDGSLLVELPNGAHEPLQNYLQQQGIGLEVDAVNAADVAPGKSGEAPGQNGTAGNSGEAPGRTGSTPSGGSDQSHPTGSSSDAHGH